MGKIPQHLRDSIAANIRACRLEQFPGRGGAMRCAAAFSHYINKNVSPQQWSPWERGLRTPDEIRLAQIAGFFGKTVEEMRRDPSPASTPATPAVTTTPARAETDTPYAGLTPPELIMAMSRDRVKAVYRVEVAVTSVEFVREEGWRYGCGGGEKPR